MIASLDRWAELSLALGLLQAVIATIIKRFKYGELPGRQRLSLDDARWLALLASLLSLCAALGSIPGAVLAALIGSAMLLGFWLDALLFRAFTIELGPSGVKEVVVSVMARELAALERVRRLLGGHPIFGALPLLATLAQLGLLFTRVQLPGGATFLAAASILALLVARGAPRATDLRFCVVARSNATDPDFAPRAEHRGLLAKLAVPSRPSARFGALSGRDVVLLSFESLGRDHLAIHRADGARTPFLESLLPDAVQSTHHFAVLPLTNNAHTVLYGRDYRSALGGLGDLAAAGYQRIYLSAARTQHYGLRRILDQAGFDTVIDGEQLRPHPLDRGRVSDHALLGSGLEMLEPLIARRPFFLHVHASNTHTPYRVVNQSRFQRFPLDSDRGRFLDGIEESDWIFGELFAAIRARLPESPLLILSSDHGQSFGELGYHSHGSAITQQQLNVPLLLHHPALAPTSRPFSSHFDLLPTVLDLLGLKDTHPGFGDSIFDDHRDPSMLVWAGHPSRSTSTNYGLIFDRGRKWMVDLIRDEAHAMDWDDRQVEPLLGADKSYALQLTLQLMRERGVC